MENEQREAVALNDLGLVARAQGHYDHAESYLKQALAIAKKQRDKHAQAAYCGNLGFTAFKRNRPTEARPWYERELTLAQEVGRQDSIAHAQAGLARVLEEEGHYVEALPLALAALQIQERLRDQHLDSIHQLVERLRRKAGME